MARMKRVAKESGEKALNWLRKVWRKINRSGLEEARGRRTFGDIRVVYS